MAIFISVYNADGDSLKYHGYVQKQAVGTGHSKGHSWFSSQIFPLMKSRRTQLHESLEDETNMTITLSINRHQLDPHQLQTQTPAHSPQL